MVDDGKPEDEIAEVLAEERSRGRRPIDTDARKAAQERRARRRLIEKALQRRDVPALITAMRDYGLAETDPVFLRILRLARGRGQKP